MSITLSPIELGELDDVNALIVRSKAYWGYDAAFMAACRDELTLRPDQLGPGLHMAARGPGLQGVGRVELVGAGAELHSLFIDPAAMGRGAGKALFRWAVGRAKELGALRMLIDSDPHAATFYEAMGAVKINETPSGSIPGRMLPRYAVAL